MLTPAVTMMLKGLLGAIVVIIISFISRTENYFVSMLAVTFPTFTLFATFGVWQNQGGNIQAMKDTMLFGCLALLPLVAYYLTFYFMINENNFSLTVGASCFAWAAVGFSVAFIKPYLI